MSLVYDILTLSSNSKDMYLEMVFRLQAKINLTLLPLTNPFLSSSLPSCLNHLHIERYTQRNKTSGFLASSILLTDYFLTKGPPLQQD